MAVQRSLTSRSQISDTIRICATSDQHTGHPNTPTRRVLTALSNAYSDDVLKDIDLAVLSGDFFDHDLSMSAQAANDIYFWILNFLTRAEKFNVIVRVLEGTPSHDYGQPKWFTDIAFSHRIPVNIRYVNTLEIEHIDELGLDILYIPDEWRNRCEETKIEVAELLNVKGLERVDLSVMHGCFPHQFPKFLHSRIDSHDPEFYSRITKHCVIIGHVHTYGQYKNILTPGSIERLSHGQEEPKGHLYLTLNRKNPKKDVYEFVENKQAMSYVTFKLTNECMNTHHLRMTSLLQRLEPGSFIRLEGPAGHPYAETLKELKDKHSLFVWSYKKVDLEKPIQPNETLSQRLGLSTLPPITPDNLKDLVSASANGDPIVLSILEDCMNV